MRTLAVTNQKGGSGKTTAAVNLAAALAERGRSVLLVDLDPQASASLWYGVPDTGRALFDALTERGSLAAAAQKTSTSGVELVPAGSWLVGVEKALAGEVGAEAILRRRIAALPETRWDFVILDCPPALGLLTVGALTAARELLVPVEAHVMALAGLAHLLQTVEVVRERLNAGLSLTGLLASRVDGRTRHSLEVVEDLRERFGSLVLETVIHENVALAEAFSFARPITVYKSRSRGAQDFRALAAELEERRPSWPARP